VEKQAVDMENAMKRLSEQHREKVALYEKQYLQQKHQLQRGATLCDTVSLLSANKTCGIKQKLIIFLIFS